VHQQRRSFVRWNQPLRRSPNSNGFAEIVSDDFPELHVDRIVPLLVSSQQSQNDMKDGMTRATTFAIAAIALLCTGPTQSPVTFDRPVPVMTIMASRWTAKNDASLTQDSGQL